MTALSNTGIHLFFVAAIFCCRCWAPGWLYRQDTALMTIEDKLSGCYLELLKICMVFTKNGFVNYCKKQPCFRPHVTSSIISTGGGYEPSSLSLRLKRWRVGLDEAINSGSSRCGPFSRSQRTEIVNAIRIGLRTHAYRTMRNHVTGI